MFKFKTYDSRIHKCRPAFALLKEGQYKRYRRAS